MSVTRFKTAVSDALTELGLGTPDGLLSPIELAMFADYIEDNYNMVPISIGSVSVEERFEGYTVFKVLNTENADVQYFRMDGEYDSDTQQVNWNDSVLREVQRVERVVYLYE